MTPFIFLKVFFTKNKEEDQSYSGYEKSYKQDNSYSSNRSNDYSYEDYNTDSKEDSYDKKYRYDNSYNYSKNDENYEKNNSYQEEDKSSYTQDESKNYEEDIIENVSDELKQFYSPSAYVVLGVSASDDFLKIKKSYRALIRIYHTDMIMMSEPDKFDLYTEISQNLNEAYEKLEKIHG